MSNAAEFDFTKFSSLYEVGMYDGYEPVNPLTDNLATPQNLEKFNDWAKNVVDTRLRKVHRRMGLVEFCVNEIGKGNPGYFKSYLSQFTNPIYRRDYTYENLDAFVCRDEFDANGLPYNWQTWGEEMVMFPIHDLRQLKYSSFSVFVYINGRPLGFDRYDAHDQQRGLTVFIPKSELTSTSVVSIEIRKFWAERKQVKLDITVDNIREFSFDVNRLAPVFNVDSGDPKKGDIIIYKKNLGDARYKLLPREMYKVRFNNDSYEFLRVTLTTALPKGTTLLVVNNAASWEIKKKSPHDTFTEYVPLVDANGQIYPVETTKELLVLISHRDEEKRFKLIPEVDYTIEENLTVDRYDRELRLKKPVPGDSTIHIMKIEPNTWFLYDKYFENAPGDGIITLEDLNLPVGSNHIDITINNKHVPQKETSDVLDKTFRIHTQSTNRNIYVRVGIFRNFLIERILAEYAFYRGECNVFAELNGNDFTKYKEVKNITNNELPNVIPFWENYKKYYSTEGSGGETPVILFDYLNHGLGIFSFNISTRKNVEVTSNIHDPNTEFRYRVKVNGSGWSLRIHGNENYEIELEPGINKIEIWPLDTKTGFWVSERDISIVNIFYDPAANLKELYPAEEAIWTYVIDNFSPSVMAAKPPGTVMKIDANELHSDLEEVMVISDKLPHICGDGTVFKLDANRIY
jgi:hypothetical protein